jgi:hypothetical protein
MENMKYGVWLVWIGGGAAILFGSGGVATAGHWIVWLTLAAHIVEFLVKRPLFERVGGSMGGHFVQTLIYGLFHWKPLEEQLAARSEG